MTDETPRFASGVTAIHGLSGSGKSSLADTAAEYVAERFNQATMCVAIDPGGWGNRRLSLIRQGIMRVYDPRNHENFFDTMEKLSKGAWPETIVDADRGYAEPNVRLVFPRQDSFQNWCPQGHPVGVYRSAAVMAASVVECPTCGVLVTSQNMTTEKRIVKPAVFNRVGLRIFDSITAMSDQGLILELPRMSAEGAVGSVLSGPDAVRQSDTVYGTGSQAQVGFMQNRAYGWLTNIRAIPDQVLGAICTFGTSSGEDVRGGGEMCYGPALAGTARTSRSGGWVGNLLHATREPDELGRMRFRLWLVNHVDPRDSFKRPYLAKHRGTPVGMPEYLEDDWHDDPAERARLALTKCSLRHFFELLEAQFAGVAAADAVRFAAFHAAQGAVVEVMDEVLKAEAIPVPVTYVPQGLRALPVPSAPPAPVPVPVAPLGLRMPGMAAPAAPAAPASNGGAAPAPETFSDLRPSAGTPVNAAPSVPPIVEPAPAAAAPAAPTGLRRPRQARPPV